MKFFPRNEDGEPASLLPVFVVAGLLGLTVLGSLGAWVMSGAQPDVEARMGPKKTYARLPEMSFTLGGGAGRNVDIQVLLEVDPGVGGADVDPYAPRIADRLADHLRDVDPAQLSGAGGARLMKDSVAAAVGRELRGVRVRDVLLDRMVVR